MVQKGVKMWVKIANCVAKVQNTGGSIDSVDILTNHVTANQPVREQELTH